MAHKFAALAFTKTVRDVQAEMGSRDGYQSMDKGEDYNHLMSRVESEFIGQRDSFYMATVSETGWPYVQHRGGPVGFMKILDANTIGFADYAGNRQYVSTGNLRTDDRISLFFMDYPNRRRLKMMGRVSTVDPGDLETLEKLEDDSFRAPIERAFLIHIEAFDWNCPKYITPRYTNAEIENIVGPMQEELTQLRSGTKSAIPARTTPNEIGNGPLSLIITAVRQEAKNIRSYELRHPDGLKLPPVEAGAHIQIPVLLEGGETIWRYYSISSDPNQQAYYQIGVLDQPHGRGGSHALHAQYNVGMTLNCYRPGNYFSLQTDVHKAKGKAVFIAGGIGITPIRSMVYQAQAEGFNFDLHYAAKSKKSAAFMAELLALGINANTYFSNEDQILDFKQIFKSSKATTIHYLCGPPAMINAARSYANDINMPSDTLVFETFQE